VVHGSPGAGKKHFAEELELHLLKQHDKSLVVIHGEFHDHKDPSQVVQRDLGPGAQKLQQAWNVSLEPFLDVH